MVESVIMSRKSYNSGGFNSSGDVIMVTGISTVTTGGALLNVDTGLSVITQVFVSIKDANQAGGDAAYCTYNHGADGLLDLYVWDDAGAAAANDATVSWMAIGTK